MVGLQRPNALRTACLHMSQHHTMFAAPAPTVIGPSEQRHTCAQMLRATGESGYVFARRIGPQLTLQTQKMIRCTMRMMDTRC